MAKMRILVESNSSSLNYIFNTLATKITVNIGQGGCSDSCRIDTVLPKHSLKNIRPLYTDNTIIDIFVDNPESTHKFLVGKFDFSDSNCSISSQKIECQFSFISAYRKSKTEVKKNKVHANTSLDKVIKYHLSDFTLIMHNSVKRISIKKAVQKNQSDIEFIKELLRKHKLVMKTCGMQIAVFPIDDEVTDSGKLLDVDSSLVKNLSQSVEIQSSLSKDKKRTDPKRIESISFTTNQFLELRTFDLIRFSPPINEVNGNYRVNSVRFSSASGRLGLLLHITANKNV